MLVQERRAGHRRHRAQRSRTAAARSRSRPARRRPSPPRRVSATTMASASPTKRALSCGSGKSGAVNGGEPSVLISGISAGCHENVLFGIGFRPSREPVAAGQHGDHARHRERRRLVDRADHGMRMRRAHHRGIGLARQAEIVGVAALAR